MLPGLPLPDGVDGLTEVEGRSPPDSGRGRVDVPGLVVVPGRVEVSGRVEVLGRDVPGRVVDEPGREELDRKSTRLNSSHTDSSRMPSSA